MRTLYKICILAILLSLFASEALADSDFRLWFEGGLRYKITKKLTLGFDQHFRMMDDVTTIESISPDLSIRYRIVKFLRVAGGYRFIFEPLKRKGSTRYDTAHRFYGDIVLRHAFKPVTLSYRLRYQEQIDVRDGKRNKVKFRQTLRNKAQAAVKLGKGFEPYVSGEIYIRFKDPNGYLHKWRGTGGLNYTYKANEFTLYVRGEGWMDGSGQKASIVGLGYHYHF